MKILFIGDIVARPGRRAVTEALPEIIKTENPDLVIANAENLASGRGATKETIEEMQSLGINYFTGGDHIFWHRGFEDEIDSLPVLRPANYPEGMAGKGHAVIELKGKRVLLVNMMGQTFINEPVENPFSKIEQLFSLAEEVDFSIVDFHGEATSDKLAFGFFVDGKIGAVVGTHTHVPTCDERVLPKGTLYISDIGMSGNIDSVLGVKKEIIIDRMTIAKKQKFDWETEGRYEFRSVLIDTDEKTIKRVDRKFY